MNIGGLFPYTVGVDFLAYLCYYPLLHLKKRGDPDDDNVAYHSF